MQFIPTNIRGPLFMVVSTGFYLVNDTMMKLATEGLPSYEVLFLRGVAASLWGMPLLLLLGYGKQVPLLLDKRVLRRNLLELAAILCYVVALANMQIADATALGQITPLLMLVGSSILFGERIGGARMALIGLGFIGALMVAQPTMQGISVYALLALGNAALSAARDLAGRKVGADVPGMIVAMSAVRGGAGGRRRCASGFRAMGDTRGPSPGADRRRRFLPDLRPFLHLHGLSRRADERGGAILL
ncbi:DMT family transporter [Mesorhizobium amorphae]|uniref:DMT family transporter n=1 Tax=Mesorhizobium amorphae TaxID=71433 RepID=UPI001FCC43D6|nr:DMT family transporter [Mesorhizobium amorphae]